MSFTPRIRSLLFVTAVAVLVSSFVAILSDEGFDRPKNPSTAEWTIRHEGPGAALDKAREG